MTLYPNQLFPDGYEVTPDIFYLAFQQVFDDASEYLGHHPRLVDDSLSNATGQLKDRVKGLTDLLRVKAATGLSVSVAAGSVSDGLNLTPILSTIITLPPNSQTFVYVDRSKAVKSGLTLPLVRVVLALVTTDNNSVTNIVDLRSGAGSPTLLPPARAIGTFGGGGEDGDYLAIEGDILDKGEYNYSSFTVPSGVSITVKQFAKIKVSGLVEIQGRVEVKVEKLTFGSIWQLAQNTNIPGLAGRGLGSRSGEIPADTYTPIQQPYGSDGANGVLGFYGNETNPLTAVAFSNPAGSGGGGLILEVGGKVTIGQNAVIAANGGSGTDAKTEQPTGNSRLVYGASAGGSGGYLAIKSLDSISVKGTVELRGGTGGKGQPNNGVWRAEGGCGGGGGVLDLFAPLVDTTTATLNLNGGLGDNSDISGANVAGAINSPGGSFGGKGGAASGFVGNPGQNGLTRVRQITPSI